ncbi:MAG TPA: hypothetical protein RMH85_04970 [Polyangiaceae bacterium LLY-WYZ-15_(1-7)]|nr:hypothetical protein [Myxococcales bacterium]HJL03028.1 hypothetical protein [Polyangiaceae bacterium LLY-WYZ-15_(1-7)]HJL07823.1 hypothetical protein [Polyangiaceae bacterium LLY-WYZ-15_(1-7)]HJL23676.1 hypothetical protein [Polyangiaceae bacterium LLY-WYZ-15_(1-7)]HJL39432.1 hypothetical protein [Polyangiaceae bacterium LLY-WYZ-15_(1-7)]
MGRPEQVLGLPSPFQQALARLWSGALPLFRRSLRDYGVLGTHRVARLANRPFGRDLGHALAVFGGDTVLYAAPQEESFRWAPTRPVAVLAGEIIEADGRSRRYRVARALALAAPAHVLLVTRPPGELRVLFEALFAAFGPVRDGEVASDAARFAADLWRTVPSRDQAEIRRLLAEVDEPPTPEQAIEAAHVRAARLAFLADGHPFRAARGLLADDPSLAGHEIGTPEGFRAACEASAPLRGVLALALSAPYLGARAKLAE